MVPLAIGTTASFEEIQPLLRQLQARLPSLDPKPMQNPKEGCISVPGTPCAGGGHRILDGTLIDAVNALTERSDPTLLPALYALLGTLPDAPRTPTSVAGSGLSTIGSGEHERIAEDLRWSKPMPADVSTFLSTGALARTTWRSPSEARMSAVLNAVLRGYSYAQIRAHSRPGEPWSGLGHSYRTKTRPQRRPPTGPRRQQSHAVRLNTRRKSESVRTQVQELTVGGSPRHPHGPVAGSRPGVGRPRVPRQPARWTVRDVLQLWRSRRLWPVKSVLGLQLLGWVSVVVAIGWPDARNDGIRRAAADQGDGGLPHRARSTSSGRDADYYALTTTGPDRITALPCIESVSKMCTPRGPSWGAITGWSSSWSPMQD